MEGATGLIGPAVMIALALVGAGVGYVTLRATFTAYREETTRRFVESEADRRDLRVRIEQVDRETVKRDDFNRFDDKIAARLDKMEHAVNNGALKTMQMVKETIRDMLPGRSAS